MAEPEDPEPLPDRQRGASISFRGVRFAYDEGPAVLDGIDLDIAPGEVVALAGRSGAGKTTLVSLVPRLFDVTAGSVLVDGVDVRRVELADLRRRIAVARQDPLLLPVSVRDNIRYGSPGVSDRRVEDAARRALADTFIHALPDGFDTVLGEKGVTLSGGQRQRLSIARALCRDSRVVILDEPTAALDAETELALLQLLRDESERRTILLVAHRLSTLRQADRIVLLDQGRIAEEGTPPVLLADGGSVFRHPLLGDADQTGENSVIDLSDSTIGRLV